MSDSVRPHRRQPTRLPHPWDSPGKNTGVGCHSLFQAIVQTQALNPGLPPCRQILHQLSPREAHSRGELNSKYQTLRAGLPGYTLGISQGQQKALHGVSAMNRASREWFYSYAYSTPLNGGFPGGTSVKEPAGQCRRHKKFRFDPWVGKILWRMVWLPTPVILPGEFHG